MGEFWPRSWAQTERSVVCNHNRALDSPKQILQARLIKFWLYGQTKISRTSKGFFLWLLELCESSAEEALASYLKHLVSLWHGKQNCDRFGSGYHPYIHLHSLKEWTKFFYSIGWRNRILTRPVQGQILLITVLNTVLSIRLCFKSQIPFYWMESLREHDLKVEKKKMEKGFFTGRVLALQKREIRS